MELYYDKEINILKELQDLEPSECMIISDDEGTDYYNDTARIIDDLVMRNGLVKWKDNSKSCFPPDFINDKDSLIMEVMRVDDHSPDGKKNPVLARERKIREELQPLLEQMPKGASLLINAVTDLPTEQDHNYRFYYLSFQRTLKKHLSKLEAYKKNHPNKKVVFLIFDETSGVYFERESVVCGRINSGRPHFPFADARFVKSFINSDLDYLIWYIPYNRVLDISPKLILPRLIVFDVKHARDSRVFKMVDYDERKMVSSEK